MRDTRTLSEIFFSSLCFLLLLLLMSQPKVVAVSMVETLKYLGLTILPSIFPFMVMSSLTSFGHSAELIGLIFYPLTRYALKISGKKAGMVIFLTLVGGFAAGATAATRLIEQKELSKDECRRLLPIIFLPSVPFSVLVAGGVFFESYEIGIMIAGATVLSAVIGAWLMALGSKLTIKNQRTKPKHISLSEHLTDGIKSSAQNMLYVTGFILFFGMISNVAEKMLPSRISFFPAVMLEFSTALPLVEHTGIYIVGATMTLLGLSSFCQVSAIMKGMIDFKTFLVSRIICVPFTMLILYILTHIFVISQDALMSDSNLYILPYQYSLELSIIAMLIIFISFKDFIRKKGLQ